MVRKIRFTISLDEITYNKLEYYRVKLHQKRSEVIKNAIYLWFENILTNPILKKVLTDDENEDKEE
nr:MAG: hypothetical protein [Lokiarchaeota virus Ratatoskr Meg22_1012]